MCECEFLLYELREENAKLKADLSKLNKKLVESENLSISLDTELNKCLSVISSLKDVLSEVNAPLKVYFINPKGATL